MAREIKQNVTTNVLLFFSNIADVINAYTTINTSNITVALSKNGQPFIPATPSMANLGNGWVSVTLNDSANHTNVLGDLVVRGTLSGAVPAERLVVVVQNIESDTYGIVSTNLDVAVSTRGVGTSNFNPVTQTVNISSTTVTSINDNTNNAVIIPVAIINNNTNNNSSAVSNAINTVITPINDNTNTLSVSINTVFTSINDNTNSVVNAATTTINWDTINNISSNVNIALTAGHGAGSWQRDSGVGANEFSYQLTSSVDSTPIADADVWVTTDAAGANTIASGQTNSFGWVVFYLDDGTYYVWRQKDGWNFSNPDTEVVP
ncbi:MAG: hypothetical protein AB1589_23085 [Cyanobacteriota bacterium]